MKKFALILSLLVAPNLVSASSWYWTEGIGLDSHGASWGYPTTGDTVVESSSNVGNFEINKKTLKKYHSDDKNTKEYQTFVAFVAHEIATHGAQFCLTQIGAWRDSTSWIFYMNPYVPGSFQCAWFCEPGYDGHRCHDETSAASACDTVNYKNAYENEWKTGVKPSDIWSRASAAHMVDFFASKYPDGHFQQQVILGATEFKEHGLVVKPILLSRNGTSTSLGLASTPANGVTKTLCAQGFTKNDKCEMSSGTCGGDIPWCRYFRENKEWGQFVANGYDSTLHYKEPSEEWIDTNDKSKGKQACYSPKCKNGMNFGTDLKCSSCADTVMGGFCDIDGNANKGKCMNCNIGQYFDKETCECKQMSTIIDKKYLVSGPYDNKQCWTIADTTEYKTCVTGKAPEENNSNSGS